MNTSRIFTSIMLLVSAGGIVFLAQNTLYNPMDHRGDVLHYEVSELETPSPYYLDTVTVDYTALKKTFTKRPKTWDQLVPGAVTQAPQAGRPNFFVILKDVIPSKRKELIVGDDVKIRVITPARPNGQWMGVGDRLHGCTITAITPEHLIVEKHKGKDRYAFKLPRK